jgi:DNA-directed RNA polymerase specialized sigma24 family protein/ribosome-associated translation inhibitor RaiA
MQYKVHNLKTIENRDDRSRVQKMIRKQILRLQHIEGNYHKPIHADFYLNRSDHIHYMVSCIIKMKEGVVFVKEKGDKIEAVIHLVFDRLKVSLNRKINKERKEYLRRFRNRHNQIFNEYMPELQELQRTETRETFNELLKILLSDVARYVKRRITSAEMTTAIRRGKFKKQEILDEIYLYVYEHMSEIPADEGNNKIWLYRIADQIMEGKFKEIEFEEENLTRLADIVDAEYAGLEEEYTVDAEEEIIPVEEIDEYESHSDLGMATILYQDDEESLLDDLTLKINKREINRLLEQEITKLPVSERTIMELYLINQMTVNEIAEIKRIPAPEIEKLTDRVGRDIKQKLADLLD